MAVIAQIGFEIRGPQGCGAEVFENVRKAHEAGVLEELAEESPGDLLVPPLTTFRGFLADARVSEDGGLVLRYFSPYWRTSWPADVGLERPLEALRELFSEERGFSGTWRYLLDEGCGQCYDYWGADPRVREALTYQFVLKPAWTRFGIHVDQHDLFFLLRQECGGAPVHLSDEDIERLSVALDPKVKDLIRATASELGMVRVRDGAEASG
jgi:hypothetical protein